MEQRYEIKSGFSHEGEKEKNRKERNVKEEAGP
jgi:hypothetical protein